MFKQLFSLTKPSNNNYFDWAIDLDMHNHVLPALDDGAPDLLTSQKLLAGLHELGFKNYLFTPHIASSLYENNLDLIQVSFDSLKNSCLDSMKNSSSWNHRFAAEYMLDDQIFNRIDDGLLSFPSQANFVLVEFSYVGIPNNWHEMIFELLKRGYQPILAHPERYSYLEASFILKKLVPAGLHLQLNLLSLSGYYGQKIKKSAEFLMEEMSYEFVGTDLHHAKQLAALNEMKQNEQISNRINSYCFTNERLITQ